MEKKSVSRKNITDREFKQMNHRVDGFLIISKGSEIEKGYKPDIVLKHKTKDDYTIVECENNSSRKVFIGGMIKAAMYLTGKRKGILVFVMSESENTSIRQIADQLKKYFEFIKSITNLKEVYVIKQIDYFSGEKTLSILSKSFLEKAFNVIDY